jgi:alpha-galactosidase
MLRVRPARRSSCVLPSVILSLAALCAACDPDLVAEEPDAGAAPLAPPIADVLAAAPATAVMLLREGSRKCVDVAGGGSGDGTDIVQWTCHGGANQTFRVEDVGGGAVRLVDQGSQKCMDVDRSGTRDGTNIQLWTCNGTGAQSFVAEDQGGGVTRLRNTGSGKCVDVNGSSNADGGNVQLWTCNDSSAQRWRLRPARPDAGDPAALTVTQAGSIVTMTTGKVQVDYDLAAGTADFSYGGERKLAGFYASVQLASYVTSRDYPARTYSVSGGQVVVTSSAPGRPTLQQIFDFTGGHRFLTRLVVLGAGLRTRWIAPVVVSTAGGVDPGSHADPRALWVPFDNDAWVTYNAAPIGGAGVSFEAAAFYDSATRNGIVVGSVLHDTWKTGVYYSGANGRLDALNVFGGATDPTWTHDVVPHGEVAGDVLYSPMVFVGYGPDWRDVMEELADVNAFYVNRLPWNGGVPFGWNSWGKVQTALDYRTATGVSDFIASDLQGRGFRGDDAVYVNLDSYWDNLSDDELARFVAHVRGNGQKAGIYWSPFVDWGKWSRRVEGSSHDYAEIWLRDGAGNPIELDGAYAIDPTHPATLRRIDHYVDRFRALGFEYLKIDFLTHGALESTVRHDPAVTTGIQAYNHGMRYLRDRIAGSMFISASIAPLFPHQYAHARRVSCDTYGAARGFASSQYQLNSASYGWWMSGRLYAYNDPDYAVLEGFSAAENKTRVLALVVSGTVFLSGDDLTRSAAQALARTYLTNPRVNQIARLGRAFRPVEGNTGTGPSEAMVLHHGGVSYLAVFNFSGRAGSRTIDLARAGLDPGRSYTVTDLWTGAVSTARGSLGVSLDTDAATLLQLH